MVVFTLMLNLLCNRGLTWISWVIVAIPFMFMGFMTIMLLYVLELDGRENVVVDDDETQLKPKPKPKRKTLNSDNDTDDDPHNDNVVYVRSNQKVVVDDVHFLNAPREYATSSSEYVS